LDCVAGQGIARLDLAEDAAPRIAARHFVDRHRQLAGEDRTVQKDERERKKKPGDAPWHGRDPPPKRGDEQQRRKRDAEQRHCRTRLRNSFPSGERGIASTRCTPRMRSYGITRALKASTLAL